jgi:hypothetical protein
MSHLNLSYRRNKKRILWLLEIYTITSIVFLTGGELLRFSAHCLKHNDFFRLILKNQYFFLVTHVLFNTNHYPPQKSNFMVVSIFCFYNYLPKFHVNYYNSQKTAWHLTNFYFRILLSRYVHHDFIKSNPISTNVIVC